MAMTPCSECHREISDKAPACPQCGAPQGTAVSDETPPRKPGWFGRIMRGAGYTFAVLFVISLLASFAEDEEKGEGTPAQTVKAPVVEQVTEAPASALIEETPTLAAAVPEQQPAPEPNPVMAEPTPPDSDLAGQLEEFRNLYEEFETFKNSREFQEVGYGTCCSYNRWAERVNALHAEAGIPFVQATDMTPHDLWALGQDYFTGSKDDPQAQERERAIRLALSGPPPQGHVKALRREIGCTTPEVFAERMTLLVASNYEGIDALTERECHTILRFEPVRGPLATHTTDPSPSGRREIFVKIETAEGKTLWLPEEVIVPE